MPRETKSSKLLKRKNHANAGKSEKVLKEVNKSVVVKKSDQGSFVTPAKKNHESKVILINVYTYIYFRNHL